MLRAHLRRALLLSLTFLLLTATVGQANFKILNYTETSGFNHGTRQVAYGMLSAIGTLHGFTVDQDSTGATFNSLAQPQQYAVVVFCNTSGSNLLDALQRANFEAYMQNGGGFVGIHAATDTYRHSTANGSDTGAWDWYAELVGASVQQNPHHVAGTPLYEMHKVGIHPTTDSLPDPWAKNEEYYYWESGYYNPGNVAVLEVEQTVGPNGMVNSYDSIRPMAWYKVLPGGGRSFYTALGHSTLDYTNDPLFRAHVRDAILWAAGPETGTDAMENRSPLKAWPNPGTGQVKLWLGEKPGTLRIFTAQGKLLSQSDGIGTVALDLEGLGVGLYIAEFLQGGQRAVLRLIVE